MNKKPTYWRWFAAMIMMVFLWSGNYQASAQCIATSPYGSGTLTGLNSVTITYCNYAGEFSTLTVDASAIGAQYSFTGTGGTGNYFTLTNTSNVPIVWGASPLVYTFSAAGTYRLHIHTSAACGTDFSCHTVIAAPVIPAPANDLCANAITISCGDVVAATTVGATTTGAPTNCLGALNTAGGVWYKFTGNGLPATVSLCGSSFDTKIGVFSGTCGALVCEAYNDDFCGASSEVSFPSVMGTEYLVYVTGYSASTGNFTLSLSCVNPGLEILTPNLSLGYRPIGAWMEPARLSIVNNPGAGAMVITAADIDNNYGGFVDVVAPALPFTLPSGVTTTAFGLTANDEATAVAGAFNGTFAIIYGGSRALATVTYDGTAYVPQPYDVVENAGTLPPTAANMAPAELPQQSSRELGGYYKNYILPNDLGTSPTDLDYVYKLTPAVDMLFSISAAFGTPVNYAVYASDFGGQGGPMATNALVQSLNTLTNYPLLAGHTYYCVASGLADFTSNYSLVPMPGPDAATYVSPLDGAINISNGMSMNWTFGANTTEYQVVLGTTYPPTTVVVPFTGTLATSYVLAGLQPNMQYFWQVNTRNTQGTTMGPVWGFTTTIDVPTGLTVTLVDPAPTAPTVSANINWTGPSDRAFIGYNVYRNGVKLNAAPLTVSQYTDLGLARNTTYSYQVSNVFDEGESTLSAPVTVTTKGVGIFNGFVYNFLGGAGIQGATVRVTGTAGDFTVATAANGSYSIQAYAGTYEFIVSAAGYTTQNLPGQAVAHGGTTPNDFYMMEVPYPVGEVIAFELNDNAVQISWDGQGQPPTPVTFRYDDGTALAKLGFGTGTTNSILGAAHFADATLEEMSWFLSADVDGGGPHATVKLYILGLTTAGVPDATNILYSATVSNVDGTWNTHVLPTPVEVTGGFFLAVAYNGFVGLATDDGIGAPYAYVPNTHYYGFDITNTATYPFTKWEPAFPVNGLIRASGVQDAVLAFAVPEIPVTMESRLNSPELHRSLPVHTSGPVWKTRTETNGTADRGIISYDVWREKVYQPGTLELIGTTFQQNFVDFDWGVQDWGVYRWAVTVNYDAGQVSAPTFSNTLEKDMYTVVDVAVTLNSNESAAGTLVTFTNISEPALELVYEETLESSGQFTWEMFRKGVYDIDVFKPGYMPQSMSAVEIFDEASFEWLLIEILAPPTDLYVTPTGFATWSGGIGTPFEPFMESFDGLTAGQIPEGWTKTPTTTNWGAHIGTQAGGVAPQMRFNWSPSGINDFYLMTPVMSTIGQSSLQLSFKHSINDYNGNYTLRVVAIADGTEHIIQEWLTPD
ncbi:MAG: carboxypeptidase regulatory-like domain-containing protein, partial [Lentimicrobium sp.]|nr:carboxypeptidase regulatory-like domain-containing protein [Lentimicrobium sp.]